MSEGHPCPPTPGPLEGYAVRFDDLLDSSLRTWSAAGLGKSVEEALEGVAEAADLGQVRRWWKWPAAKLSNVGDPCP